MRIRLPYPRLLRLIGVLMLLFSAITGVVINRVQASQPMPMCVLYNKWNGNGTWGLGQVDSRNGQTNKTFRNYYMMNDFSPNMLETTYSGQASMTIFRSNYSGPNLLLAGVHGSEKMRQVAMEFDISGGWSPDGSAYGYVFNPIEGLVPQVAFTDAAGNSKRVYSLEAFESEDAWRWRFGGWSADGKYMAAYADSVLGTAAAFKHYFFDVSNAQSLPHPIIAQGQDWGEFINGLFWSPQGHRFAYVTIIHDDTYLIIATPEQGIEQQFSILDRWQIELPLIWSPDGRYVVLHSVDSIENTHGSYRIFGIDGSAQTDIMGQQLYRRADMSIGDRDEPPDSWWSAEGSTWYFRQQIYQKGSAVSEDNLLSYLVAYHAETQTTDILAEHVAGSPLAMDNKHWFAVPLRDDNGTVEIALIAADGNTRTTLIKGATLDPLPRLVWSESNRGTVAAIWKRTMTTGQQLASLTWARADGSNLHTVDHNFEEITELHWLNDQRSLLYVARRGERYTIGVVDLETGESLFQLTGLPQEDWGSLGTWQGERVFSSPSGQQLVLRIGKWERQWLYLVMLPTKQVRRLYTDGIVMGIVRWAPDSSAFVFMQYGFNGLNDTMRIISADGITMQAIDMQQQYSQSRQISASTLSVWSWCQ